MTAPFVSVLIDTYNHERFIGDAIQSVLAQDYPASQREIVVVDDGSTDSTPEILRGLESKVRVVRKPNGGQASAFNLGLAQCTGEIVCFLDGDDWWAPNKVTRVVQVLSEESEVGIIGHGIVTVNRDGSQMVESLRDGFRFQANTMEGAKLLRARGAFLGTSRMAVRRSLLERIGLVPEGIKIQADEYLFTVAAVLAVARVLPEALTFYRLHEANRFQLSTDDPSKLRRKQQSLALLAKKLNEKLAELGIANGVRQAVTQYMQACADQLRLQLDGGWSWETVGTEWRIYEAVHSDADRSHQVFKLFTLIGALVLPPRWFYGARRSLVQNAIYRRARERFLPVPEMRHLDREHLPRR